MTQAKSPTIIEARPDLLDALPAEPEPSTQVAELNALSVNHEKQQQLVCWRLLEDTDLARAKEEASKDYEGILNNTQALAVYGIDALESLNRLTDRMLRESPPIDIPELREIVREMTRRFRGVGRKYDPKENPEILEKYERTRGKFLGLFRLGKTFLEEFLDDIRDIADQCDWAEDKLDEKKNQILRVIAYYDERYKLGEEEIGKVIYVIAKMELMCELAAENASQIVIGDSNLGDRGAEDQARIAELVTLLQNRIITFTGRLWTAWAMAPQIRYMRVIQVGISARIDLTKSVTIPDMKDTINLWISMGVAQQAKTLYEAMDDTANEVKTRFAGAAKVFVPAAAASLATPYLNPATVVAWTESLEAQAEGFIEAIELGEQKRAELINAIITSRNAIDVSTGRVNQAQIEHVLAIARQADEDASSVKIVRSVPTQS